MTGCIFCRKRDDSNGVKAFGKCDISGGKPCHPCNRHVELERKIAETRKLLEDLLSQQRELRTDINRIHDPILTRFPREIISLVFYWSLPDYSVDARSRSPSCSPLTLGAVCRAWRQIAWSAPQLWSHIHIAFDMSYSLLSYPSEVIQEWVFRSGQRPLSISITIEECFHDNWLVEQESEENSIRIIDIFNPHSSRWQSLSVYCQRDFLQYFTGDSRGAPILENLNLAPSESSTKTRPGEDRFSLAGGKPQPKSVSISDLSYNLLDISWNNVTDVSIGSIEVHDGLQLLQSASRLERCHFISLLNGDRQDSSAASLPVVQHTLQSLVLVAPYGQKTPAQLLGQLTLPSLQLLSIEVSTWDEPIPTNILVSLVERSSCPLKTLKIVGPGYGYEDTVAIFTGIPCIEELNMSPFCVDDDDLKDILLVFARTNDNLGGSAQLECLPNLQRFSFDIGAPQSIPWGLIPDILGPVGGPRRPLSRLTINDTSRPSSNNNLKMFVSKNVDRDTIERILEMVQSGVALQLPGTIDETYLMGLLQNDDHALHED